MFKLKKSKSFEILQDVKPKQLVVNSNNKFHGTDAPKARSSSLWNIKVNKEKIEPLKFATKMDSFNFSIKKGKEIEVVVQKAEFNAKAFFEVTAHKSFNTSKNTFEWALMHDVFYDVIKEDGDNIIIAFLPFSTSNRKVLCGLEKFDKVHLLTNGLKDFNITRILFYITMTKKDFIKWEADSKLRYQDLAFRKQLFNEVQKDLDKNLYSLLKDSDLQESNVEFFTNDLPKINFKFSDFVS